MSSFNTSATQSGRVVQNATLDIDELAMRKTVDLVKRPGMQRLYGESSYDDQYLHILPGEPLFMNAKQIHGKRRGLKDTHLSVFSALNGILAKRDESPDDKEKDLKFVGFADIKTEWDSKKIREEDALTQLGGIRTIRNTGHSRIKPGQLLYWSLPTKSEVHGQRNKKILGKITPVDLPQTFSKKSFIKRMNTSGDMIQKTYAALSKMDFSGDEYDQSKSKEAVAGLLVGLFKEVFTKEYVDIQSKVIGKALSEAQPGKELDIVLGSYSI